MVPWPSVRQGEIEAIDAPFERKSKGLGIPGFGTLGAVGIIGSKMGSLGFREFLAELGRFNPIYVEPFYMHLMKRAVMPRLALIILSSALAERQYVVEGANPEIEAFHQKWIDRGMKQILRRAANAIWFGWQPFIIDWAMDDENMFVPHKFHDVDPFATHALEDEKTRQFAGLATEGANFGIDRSFKLTWQGDLGNHYGEGQAITCYPFWWAHSVTLVWTMRYYERSVDPVRIAMARNISVPTGRLNDDGSKEHVDLTTMIAEALDVAAGGDSMAIPLGASGDENMVDIKELNMPDRSDTWLKMLHYLEQKQFLSTLSLPAVGLGGGGTGGGVTFESSRIAEKTQLRVLEFASDMPIQELNENLLPLVHRMNRLPGPVPTVKGKAFKREQEESLRAMFTSVIDQPVPHVGEDGRPSGLAYRPADLLRFDKIAKSLDLPSHEIEEVARDPSLLGEQAAGKGGRPENPQGDRASDRQSGIEDR